MAENAVAVELFEAPARAFGDHVLEPDVGGEDRRGAAEAELVRALDGAAALAELDGDRLRRLLQRLTELHRTAALQVIRKTVPQEGGPGAEQREPRRG